MPQALAQHHVKMVKITDIFSSLLNRCVRHFFQMSVILTTSAQCNTKRPYTETELLTDSNILPPQSGIMACASGTDGTASPVLSTKSKNYVYACSSNHIL